MTFIQGLQKALPIVAVLLLSCVTARGQVLYTDVDPDSTVSATTTEQEKGYYIDLDHDGHYEFEVRHFNPDPQLISVELQNAPDPSIVGQVLIGSDGHARVLSFADTVGKNSSTWGHDCCGILNDPWYSGEDSYFGFRVKKSGKWHYAWARITIPVDRSSFTIKDFAYNQTPDSPIVAGQTTTAAVQNYTVAQKDDIQVFPNPLSSSATIHFNSQLLNAHLVLCNMLGEQVKEISGISGNEIVLDRAGIANGVYVLRLLAGNTVISSTMILIQD